MQPTEINFAKDRYGWTLELLQYEIQRLWTIFSIFLLSETVLFSGVLQLLSDKMYSLSFGGAALGLLLILPWWTTFEYTRYFYLLRISQAKELEPSTSNLIIEGHLLSKGKKVGNIKIPAIIRFFRPQRSAWFLMIIFAIGFILSVVLSIYHLINF